jgi:hypothetical protein
MDQQNQSHGRDSFRLEICGLDAFRMFCAIIRGDTMTQEQIDALAQSLKGPTDALTQAVNSNQS